MSRPPAQTTLYSLDRTESLTASHVADDRQSEDKVEKSDAEAQPDQSSTDIEQDDGVTRIEALCKQLLTVLIIADLQISSLAKDWVFTPCGHLLV